MSLMKSLARVAAGIMLAKGIGTMMKGAQGGSAAPGGSTQARNAPSGSILDEILGRTGGAGRQPGAGSGGLGEILGQVLGGRGSGMGSGSPYGGTHSPTGRASGGLGGILDQLTAGRGATNTTAGSGGGGLGGSLGQILGGGAAAGGLGGILGELLGGSQANAGPGGGLAQKDAQPSSDASFGEVLNDALVNGGEPSIKPTPEQNAVAGLILKAMIQAAKSDGKIDEAEQARLTKEFGELDDEERAFIKAQMDAPVDAAALAKEVPQGLGPQVYMMSLLAIDFDSRSEAEYLHTFATALGLDKATVNGIHEKVGATNLYA
ncbi:DUF533 domain-containing protein [Paracoccus ravus]|uniref:DUF533 domain-containing protein n=1 Tax=Paracoccus ravus TaxID=2447760 RepID=UPI00106EA2BD|nr:DUF533 domain-containing protein [Paracoccus ravus]